MTLTTRTEVASGKIERRMDEDFEADDSLASIARVGVAGAVGGNGYNNL